MQTVGRKIIRGHGRGHRPSILCAKYENRRAEIVRETRTVVQKSLREAAPGREGARHPKCEPSSGNATHNVYRHAEIHAGGSAKAAKCEPLYRNATQNAYRWSEKGYGCRPPRPSPTVSGSPNPLGGRTKVEPCPQGPFREQ